MRDRKAVLIPTGGLRSRRDGHKGEGGETPSLQVTCPPSPAPDAHAGVASSFPRARPHPPATQDLPPRPRHPHRPVTGSAPGPDPLPSRPPPPISAPPGAWLAPITTPVPAGPAHPVAGGASSSSQSASRAPRSDRVRWRLWARAPHAASQEEASGGRRVSGGCTVSVSIWPPTRQASSGTSLTAL